MTTLGERPAQHLAALAERRPHEREQRVGVGRPAASCRTISTSADSTFGRGTNTDAGTCPTIRAVAQYATFTLTAPYGRRARARRRTARPTSRCTITSIRSIAGTSSSRSHDERRGDVVRQVGDEHPAVAAGEQRRPSRARIASASTTVTFGAVGDDLAQHGDEAAVDLDGGDVGAGLGERQRQRAEAGADLDDVVAGADAGEVGDAAHGVGVGDEVLPEVAPRRQAGLVEQLADRRPRDASSLVHVISTGTGASVRSAICANVAVASTIVVSGGAAADRRDALHAAAVVEVGHGDRGVERHLGGVGVTLPSRVDRAAERGESR